MCELAAQVTSSLLHFPEVTVDALGEDEIRLDSVLHGKFTAGKSGLAWLACGPHLEVVQANTGERFSAYCFSGVSEHAPNVLAVHEFCWLKRSGLLVGLEESAGSVLCLYDLSISRVVKAVVIPGRITAIEPLVSYGGASSSTQHLHQSLRWFFGVVAVVTDVGHVLLVDLCLDDPSCSQSELEASDLEVVNKSPAEVPHIRERVTQQGRHLCLQLSTPSGTSATALQYVTRTNLLAVGFSDGYLQLWNMKTLKKEYHSQLEGGRVPVYAFTFQEPENDPRNCCYLWAVQSTQDHEGDVVSLHLLQLAFGERKCLALGKILYEGLEYCEERYSQDLNDTAFPSRAQATNMCLLGCQTIEKFRHHPDRDDSMNEGASPDTSVSMFSWQVKSYGQCRPTTYVGLFDINRWYHAQMPDSLRTGETLHNCPYLAVWSLDSVVEMTSPCSLLDIVVHERSLSRGLPYTCPLPEQFFNPTTYNFDATCLLNSGIMHVTCSGYQKETLSFLKKSVSSLSETIPDGYARCLMSGLLSPCLMDGQPSILSQEGQLDAVLSTAVETSSLGLITGCIRRWTSEEQPGSAVNLCYILEWAWNKVVLAKEELDGICAPLFDSSINFTDPQTLQLLQHSQRLLGNLSTVFHCLLNEAHELTQKGLVGLINKNVVSSLISQYAQVVLWFCRTGLLPEGSDDDVLQISRPFYNYPVIKNYYTGRREELLRLSRGKWCSDCLMIDGLVGQYADCLRHLWKRDGGGTGQYPPPTLHALLDIYLLENMEESAKHAIVIYLLLDVMYSLPNKSGTSVESFPTAFAIPIGLVKLVQGLWLLDHLDHENSVELLLHPATSRSLWAWQHGRVLQALMCQGQHAIALRYLHTMSPHMSSTCQVMLCLSVLLHNRCIVEAWALVRQHSNKLNIQELLRFLYETCLELGLMEELFKLPLGLAEQDCLDGFLQGSGGSQNHELLMVHYLQQANYVPALQLNQALRTSLNDPKYKERSNTRNSILDQYGKVLPRVQRKLATERVKPYHHPSTIHKEVSRPQPLSTLPKRSVAENVLTRASFLSNVLTKIGEVWEGKDGKHQSSLLKRASGLPLTSSHHPSTDLAEAFVGTPVRMTSKRMTRILGLMVQTSAEASPEGLGLQRTPATQVITQRLPSPVSASSLKPGILLGTAKAPELSLLQTPPVVKRARALAVTGPVFPVFTPQSILRSSLRPTPVGSPSASLGRSATPPPRPKESRITFIEESKNKDPWSNGIPAENEVCLLSSTSPLPKPGVEGLRGLPPEEEDEEEQDTLTFVPQALLLRQEVGESESCCSVHEVVEDEEEDVVGVAEISSASTCYIDSTMELHEAPTPEDPEDKRQEMEVEEVVAINMKSVVPEVFPLPPTCTGIEKLDEAPGEQEDVEPVLGQEEVKFNLVQEFAEPNQEQEVAEPNLGQEAGEPGLGQQAGESGLGQQAGESDLGPQAGESDLGQQAGESDLGQQAGESDLGQQAGESDLGQQAEESGLGQKAGESDLGQQAGESGLGQQAGESGLGQQAGESGLGQQAGKSDLGQQAGESDLGQQAGESDLGQQAGESDLGQQAEQSDLGQQAEGSGLGQQAEGSGLGQQAGESDLGKQAGESDLGQEVSQPDHELGVVEQIPVKEVTEPMLELEKASLEQEQVEYSFEEGEAKQCTVHLGLDEFVERHLFGNDLSSPLTRSSIRQASQAWATSSYSECSFNARKEAPAAVGPTSPVLTTQKSVTSVSSGATTTTDSHSVVSLNGSEELSGANSEEDSDTTAEEEDSESDVEIIEQMEGNECQQQPQDASLFQQEPPLGLGYLQEQATAMPSVVTPVLLEAMEAVGEEEEVDIVDLKAEDRAEPMCFIELRPSDTLLVPLDPDEDQHLDLPKMEDAREAEEPYTDGSNGFTLTLESLENRITGSVEDSDSPLLIMQLPQPGGTQLQQPVHSQEIICLDKVNSDSCEAVSLLPAQPYGLMTQTSKESAITEQVDREVLSQIIYGAQMVEEGLVLIESKEPGIPTKKSKATEVEDAPEEERIKEEESACLLEEETACLISEVEPNPSAESESNSVVQVAEPGSAVEEVEPEPVVKKVDPVPAVVEAELATVFEQTEPTVVEEEVQTGVLLEETESSAVPEEAEAEPGVVVEEAVTGAVVDKVELGAVFEEAVTGVLLEEAESSTVPEEVEPGAVIEVTMTGAVVEAVEPGAVVEEAVTGVLFEEAESRAVPEEPGPGPVVEEAVTGAVVKAVEPGAVIEELKSAPVVKEAEPAPEVAEIDPVPLYSGAHLGVNVAQQIPIKSMKEAELSDTSVEVGYSIGSKVRSTGAEMHMMTRQRKTITFHSTIDEAKSNMQSIEEQLQHEIDSKLPLPPTRFPRRTKYEQDSQIHTPRRTRRIGIEPEPQKEDKAIVKNISIESKTKSSKKQTLRNILPRQGTRRTQNSSLNAEDVPDTEESIETEVLVLPLTRSRYARKTRVSVMEVPGTETPLLLEAKAEAFHSPGMMTRKSSLFLGLETTQAQIVGLERKGATPKRSLRTGSRSRVVEQGKGSAVTAEEQPPPNFPRHITRSSLGNHLAASKGEEKEDHLVLGTPLDVESGTELASALMERFNDKGAKGSKGRKTSNSGTMIIRATRGTVASSPPPAKTEAPLVTEELLLGRQGGGVEADIKNQTQSKAQKTSRRTQVKKASDMDSSLPRDSFLCSPPQTRRKTKGKRVDSLIQNDIFQVAFSAPTTRTRQAATSTLSHAVVNNEEGGMGAEVVQQKTETAKPRKKRTTRRNVGTGSPPPVKINLISPMASPELAPGVERKEKGEGPLQRMNLRRKRLLETVFPKPATRRKML
ncbi:protein ELYS isoform X1 [Anguilla rostrata]|uniref:protein ELYS isoform X1 n=1 Tax=Anguilla rostrata TaxID=7938 RepID=UPI0030CCA230